MKKSITRAVSRSAARFRRIHVIVRNEGCEPLQWHYNGLHEVSQDEFVRVRRRGSLSVSSSWRSHWVWISADCACSQRRGLCQSRRGDRVLLRRLRERSRRWLLGLKRRRQRRRPQQRRRRPRWWRRLLRLCGVGQGGRVRARWRRSPSKRSPRSCAPVSDIHGRLNLHERAPDLQHMLR